MSFSQPTVHCNKVLIIDDDPKQIFVVSRILAKHGYMVEEAHSGEQGLEKAKQSSPDLILLDVVMPVMDGFETCRRIKSDHHLKEILLILLSSQKKSSEYRTQGLDAGADGFITRPFNSAEFVSRIKSMMRIKAVEKKLRVQHQWLRVTMSSIGDALIATDTQKRILFMNNAAESLTGYTAEEARFKSAEDICRIVNEMTGRPVKNPIEKVLQEGRVIAMDDNVGLIGRDRKVIPISDCAAPICNDDGKIIGSVLIFRDITESKAKMDKERQAFEKRLHQAQKMEAIGNLAGGIAHDFNNILSCILGYAELALDDMENTAFLKEYLTEIFTAGQRARELIKQILTFARRSDEELKPIAVDIIAKEVLKFIRSSIPSNIEIRRNIASSSLINGNPTQIHQILMNLCANAAHAMENHGGVLSISLTDVIVDGFSHQAESGLKPGNYIQLKISDTGVGIPPEIIDSVFEPYFTTKKKEEGTGMGLAVVHSIVESYGGNITVRSRLSKGTVFTIHLPVCKKGSLEHKHDTENPQRGSERILLIDDEVQIVKIGKKILERLGYLVHTSTSSVNALKLFRLQPDHFDLVITDMAMPHITGDELAAEFLKIRSDIPIILCTGYSKKLSNANWADAGIKALINKPFTKADMSDTVRRVLDQAKVKREDKVADLSH